MQYPYLQIRLYQLNTINQSSIIKSYLSNSLTHNNYKMNNNINCKMNNNINYKMNKNINYNARRQQQQRIPINLVTKQRNYYIDMLLQQNQQLIIQSSTNINNNYHNSLKNNHNSIKNNNTTKENNHDTINNNHNSINNSDKYDYKNSDRLQTITKSKISLPIVLQVIYPQQQYKINTHTIPTLSHFTILHKLSQGAFAQIFLAQIKYNRNLIAIKRINKIQYTKKSSKKQLLNQIQLMKYRYWGKVSLKYLFQDDKFVYLTMDYCTYGTLYDLIKRQNQVKGMHNRCQQCQILTKQQKISIWLQVAFTITHMHTKGYLYRDLKPQNILINHNGQVKLCDFGHSVSFIPNQKFTDLCGTLEYIPPQIVNNQEYDKTVDIYALGILLYELINGKTPFNDITFENMRQLKSVNKFKYDKKTFTNQEIRLISALTSLRPQHRLGNTNSLNIFRHPFFQQQYVKQLAYKVMKREKDYELLLKLTCKDMQKFTNPPQLREYNNTALNDKFLSQPFNYLQPKVSIQQKIGPKFNSAF